MDERIKQMQEDALKQKQRIEEITSSSNDLDTVINFKVNSAVKQEFDRICKKDHSSISRELKLYMLQIIRQGRI